MVRKVKPTRDAEPRTIQTYRREVFALLVQKGISADRAARLLGRWDVYVRRRWSAGRPPCAVSDHLARWDKEGVVCPCKRGGDPSPKCKIHGRRRVGRDANTPRVGEVYEAKTSGRRWEVVKVDGERIVMKPVGARSQGEIVWSKQALKGMKPLRNAVSSLLSKVLGTSTEIREKDDGPGEIALEAAARRGSDPNGRRRRLARKGRRRVRRKR